MSGRTKEELAGITKLGSAGTTYASDYAPEVLEYFINKHQDRDYFVKFNCPPYDRAAGLCHYLYLLCAR